MEGYDPRYVAIQLISRMSAKHPMGEMFSHITIYHWLSWLHTSYLMHHDEPLLKGGLISYGPFGDVSNFELRREYNEHSDFKLFELKTDDPPLDVIPSKVTNFIDYFLDNFDQGHSFGCVHSVVKWLGVRYNPNCEGKFNNIPDEVIKECILYRIPIWLDKYEYEPKSMKYWLRILDKHGQSQSENKRSEYLKYEGLLD